MKIKCMKSNLLTGVNIVSKAVPSKTTMAILECILIDASANSIKLISNDLELGIETVVQGEIIENGIIALDAKIFSEMVRKLPDAEVTITTDGSFKTNITCGKSKFDIVGKSGDDFSYLPSIDTENPIVLSQLTLRDIVKQTIFSINENDNNKLMSGELLEIEDKNLRLVALDGHRIAIRNVELTDSYEKSKTVIPGKALSEVTKILTGGANDKVNIFISDKHIAFIFDNTTVVSRLLEGEFFNVDNMLQGNYETKMRIYKKDLIECIDRATLLAREGDKKPIVMDIKDGNLNLRIQSFIGSMDEDIEIEKNGKDMMIAFNPKFCLDVLRVIDDEEVEIYLLSPKAPCFIKDADETYVYMILPVNFNAGV